MKTLDELLLEINALSLADRIELRSKIDIKMNEPIADQNLIKIVCQYYGISTRLFFSRTRTEKVAHARHIYMYLARTFTDFSLSEIGIRCGNRDHATVLYGFNKIEKLIKTKPQIKIEIDFFNEKLAKESSELLTIKEIKHKNVTFLLEESEDFDTKKASPELF